MVRVKPTTTNKNNSRSDGGVQRITPKKRPGKKNNNSRSEVIEHGNPEKTNRGGEMIITKASKTT